MFHEVKVLDPTGKLKKTLTSKELSKQYWNEIYSETSLRSTLARKGKKLKKNAKN